MRPNSQASIFVFPARGVFTDYFDSMGERIERLQLLHDVSLPTVSEYLAIAGGKSFDTYAGLPPTRIAVYH